MPNIFSPLKIKNLASDGFPSFIVSKWLKDCLNSKAPHQTLDEPSLHSRNCIISKTLPENMSKQKIDFSAAGIFTFFFTCAFLWEFLWVTSVSALPFCSRIVIRIRHILRRSGAITRRDRTKRNHFPTPSKPVVNINLYLYRLEVFISTFRSPFWLFSFQVQVYWYWKMLHKVNETIPNSRHRGEASPEQPKKVWEIDLDAERRKPDQNSEAGSRDCSRLFCRPECLTHWWCFAAIRSLHFHNIDHLK